jgi:hypothetical protein
MAGFGQCAKQRRRCIIRTFNIKEMRTAMPNGHADSTLQLREPTLHDDRGNCRPIITTMHRNISRKLPFEERLTEIL